MPHYTQRNGPTKVYSVKEFAFVYLTIKTLAQERARGAAMTTSTIVTR